MSRSRRQHLGLAAVALVAAACGTRPAPVAPAVAAGDAAGGASSMPVAPAAAPAGSTIASALPFIEDDYPRALAEARRRNVPIFVEAWAPW